MADLFQTDGLHLSDVGTIRFVRVLSEAVRQFHYKKLFPNMSLAVCSVTTKQLTHRLTPRCTIAA